MFRSKLGIGVCTLVLLPWVSLFAGGPNLVVNGGFDNDVSNWSPVIADATWSDGAARLTLVEPPFGVAGELRQCISIPGLTAGRKFRWGGKVYIPPGQEPGSGYMFLAWVTSVSSYAACGGQVQVLFGGSTEAVGQWVSIDALETTVPPGAVGAQISFHVAAADFLYGELSILVDDAYLVETGIQPAITISGPQSGRTAEPLVFEGAGRECTPTLTGWNWTASGGANIIGGSTRTASIEWPSAGAFTVTAANSGCSPATATHNVNITVPPPEIVAALMPRGIVQAAQAGGGTDALILRNSGGLSTRVVLTVDPALATLSPSEFDLAAGEQRTVAITGAARDPGLYETDIVATGTGAQTLSIPLRLLSASPPAGTVVAAPDTSRVDVSAGAGQNPTGSVRFANSGNDTLVGMMVSSVPWMRPQGALVTIPPSGSATATFTIERARRPDSDDLLGSASGELSLVYPSGVTGSSRSGLENSTTVSVSTVSVVDTVRPPVTIGAIPPLGGAIALFLSGVGHTQGSVGLFTTDISLVSRRGLGTLQPAKLYYTAVAGGPTVIIDVPALPLGSSAAFVDFVKGIFQREGEVGTLQIRSDTATAIGAAAAVLNVSNPAGTFGTALPVLRSDLAQPAGEVTALSGLRSDGGAHTNIYVQETSGAGATVQLDFFDPTGIPLGTRTDAVAPFGLLQLGRVVPDGAVSALVTNVAASAGRLVAFATPVDRLSGDTWTVADWRQLNEYSFEEEVIVPIAGAVHGANQTYFRTDVAIMNAGEQTGTATVRYQPRDAAAMERTISMEGKSTAVLDDIVSALFGLTTDSLGFLRITPSAGSRLAVSSRTYTTASGSAATYGTGVPAQGFSSTLQAGDLRRIAGIQDATLATIQAARPATFRSNLGLMEVSGQPVTVRVTLRFVYPTGKVSTSGTVSKDYFLAANQFLLTSLTRDILGPRRDDIGDLKNIVVEVSVTGGEGRVAFFVSSVDNGTGDTILLTE